MTDFFEIKCLDEAEQRKILDKIKKSIEEKKKEGLFTDREIQEIEKMKLKPLPDIQDVQSVYENFMYTKKG
jgi:hypothetical protein